MIEHIYLTRRNLQTLLNKLDRPESSRRIIKDDTAHPEYPCSTRCIVIAIEDEDYYTDREPGPVDPEDDPNG